MRFAFGMTMGIFFKSLVEKEITRETQAMNEFKALLNQV